MKTALFSTVQWITWVGALLTACITITVHAYQTFETKEQAEKARGKIESRVSENKEDMKEWLGRIDTKLDRLLEEKRR